MENSKRLCGKTLILTGIILIGLVTLVGCKKKAEPVVSKDTNTKQKELTCCSEKSGYLILVAPESKLVARAAERLQS